MRIPYLFTLILLLVLSVSCGDDDDGGDTTINVPQEETPTPPTTGTNRPTRTRAERNQANITTVMNRMANESTITGSGEGFARNADGTVTRVPVRGTIDVVKLSDTSWTFTSTFCTEFPACTVTETFALNNGELTSNGVPVRINSTTSSSLNLSTTESSGTVNRRMSFRNDKLSYAFRILRDGLSQASITFEED